LVSLFILSFLFCNAFAAEKIPVYKNHKIDTSYGRALYGNYPQIEKMKDAALQKTVNDKIKELITSWEKKAQDEKLSIEVFYSVSLLDNKFFSMKFETEASDFMGRSAHPDNQVITFNYDFNSKNEILLADIFPQNVDYLKLISDIAIPDLLKQEQVDVKDVSAKNMVDWIKKGAGPKEENYKNFVLTKNSLIVIFQYYQVGPRYFGTPSVEIPYEKLGLQKNNF
jgi:hypothetical protein